MGVTHREGVKECVSWRKEVRKEKKRGMERGGEGTSLLSGFVRSEAKTKRVGGTCCPQEAVTQASGHPLAFGGSRCSGLHLMEECLGHMALPFLEVD